MAYAQEGFHTTGGICFAAVVKVDVTNAVRDRDGYQIILRHALEIVRRELRSLTDVYAAAARKEGIAVVLRMSTYRVVAIKQCFTKIQKEIEQCDPFREIRCTVCFGSRQTALDEVLTSMRQALWLCRDRLCRMQSWRDAETERIAFHQRYFIESAQKKRLQVAAECLDEARFWQELDESFRVLMDQMELNGQMVED